MRSFLRPLALIFLIFLTCAEEHAQSATNSDPPSAAQLAGSTPIAPRHAQKVWTNDNIGAVAVSSSAAPTGSSSSDRRSFRSHSSRSHLINGLAVSEVPYFQGPGSRKTIYEISSSGVSIVNPSAGTVVSPGEVLHIEASADSDKDISGMGIVSPLGFGNETRMSPPWSFTLNVPREEVGIAGPLIDSQPLYADFRRCGNDQNPQAACNQGAPDSASTEVDVEDPTPATKLWSRIPSLSFDSINDSDHLNIVAVFVDGLELEVTRSTYISFSSTNPTVAAVDDDGLITRVGTGKAEIEVTYVGGGVTTKLSIHVESWIPRNAGESDLDRSSNPPH